MNLIQLTRGFIALVDEDQYEELNSYQWYASGLEGRPARKLIEPERRMILMYHQILNVWPWELRLSNMVVDHINRNPLDNRKVNLRVVSYTENMRNTDRHLKRKGIAYDATNGRWKVYIDMPGYVRYNVGTFKTIEKASTALDEALEEMGIEDHPHTRG